MSDAQKQRIVDAVLYAMREGCFFPVPRPQPPTTVRELIQQGAMRNLHAAVAEATRGSRDE
jgi:hypothetical protein